MKITQRAYCTPEKLEEARESRYFFRVMEGTDEEGHDFGIFADPVSGAVVMLIAVTPEEGAAIAAQKEAPEGWRMSYSSPTAKAKDGKLRVDPERFSPN